MHKWAEMRACAPTYGACIPNLRCNSKSNWACLSTSLLCRPIEKFGSLSRIINVNFGNREFKSFKEKILSVQTNVLKIKTNSGAVVAEPPGDCILAWDPTRRVMAEQWHSRSVVDIT